MCRHWRFIASRVVRNRARAESTRRPRIATRLGYVKIILSCQQRKSSLLLASRSIRRGQKPGR